ncbi:DNA-binding response OmpR family regulator [Catenibacillus scindens]|uniref:Stage 0 sporulation protein A homolog n=1 Tax=Catenibacillus scindens TaxID=673271 RepID=A0A7W8HD50_9FIRM|nr:response regulator transcription factor [Catenibacillus scindens]MBB5266264.1 DNA-binding response OmpR family regulator [Catenibacillus scindens]
MKILIVEDEEKLRNSLAEGLRLKGYAIDVAGDGESADEKAFYERYDLIILDLNLPKLDGFSVLENFRKENLDVPVLILSARDGIEDKVKGLDLGANDYLTKPFHFAELEARMRSLLRRKTVIENTVLSSGSLCFDTASRIVTAAGHPVSLTTKENALLEYLLLHKGRVIKLEELIEHVWDSNADTFSNSVRVHMSSLRRKLKAQLRYDPICNIIGEGYVIREEGSI